MGSGVFLCRKLISLVFLSSNTKENIMDIPSPLQVQIDTEAQSLSIEWEDGHTSVFPLDALREACPCASCKGHAVTYIPPPSTEESSPSRRWTDVTVETAGSIGLRIEWDDGHNAGIFRWDRLRELQPPSS